MFSFLAQIARLVPAKQPSAIAEGVAQQLMHKAEARAGFDSRQARELRGAACAYLRVVR